MGPGPPYNNIQNTSCMGLLHNICNLVNNLPIQDDIQSLGQGSIGVASLILHVIHQERSWQRLST